MQTRNAAALKEWAVVCDALAGGQQQLLFRKGGIHEGPDGFRPEHDEFWLFPTGFHQSTEGIVNDFARRAADILTNPPEAGFIAIQHYARINDVFWIEDESRLAALQAHHILTRDALKQRFHYRRPGIFVLVVDMYTLTDPIMLPADPRYDGCRSWVQLSRDLPTHSLSRCLDEADFVTNRRKILRSLGEHDN